MNRPLVSIVIPTRDRPQLVLQAVESALAQTFADLEVIVVDDASTDPVHFPADPRLRSIYLSTSHGGAGARNVGTQIAKGRWISYLDDDDRLLPHMAEVGLNALEQTVLPPPVGVISGIEVVNAEGEVLQQRLPPPYRPRGAHFSLEDLEPGYSYHTKQTLMVEREVMLQIGGWDESFRSRVHTELFLRLNPVCSLLGLPRVTYQLRAHEGYRVSRDRALRQESFQRLVNKHRHLFEAHRQRYARCVYEHALTSYRLGHKEALLPNLLWAMQLAPLPTLAHLTASVLLKLKSKPT